MIPLSDDMAKIETHHGVLMRINTLGVLITGTAGSGKSSLALELLHQQHALIADDIIEFHLEQRAVIGRCPPLLKGLLHQREIGLLNVRALFGEHAVEACCRLDVVVHLDPAFQAAASLQPVLANYRVHNQDFPQITLNPNNPAQLSHRLSSWLAMRQQQNAHIGQQAS